MNTALGRFVRDRAAQMLAVLPERERDSPLTVAGVVSVAELEARAAALRRDPASDPGLLIRVERLIESRLARLGLGVPSRPRGRPPLRLFK
jgi:hypothetical protein